MLKLLYFASLVDRLGCASEQLAMDHIVDVRSLVNVLKARGGVWEDVFSCGMLRITVNKQFAALSTPLQSGDEVAFIAAN